MTAPAIPKIKPTRQQVLEAFTQDMEKPVTLMDTARSVSVAAGHGFEVPHVNTAALKTVMEDLVGDGLLVAHPGHYWVPLAPRTYDIRPTSRYYTLPSLHRAWQAKASDEADAVRLHTAQAFAREVLAAQYPNQYQEVTRALLAAADMSAETAALVAEAERSQR